MLKLPGKEKSHRFYENPLHNIKHFQLEIAEKKDRQNKTSQTTDEENSASFMLTFISLNRTDKCLHGNVKLPLNP